MTDVYIHVGLPKTGTSFLQERCFPRLKGVHIVGQGFRAPPTGMVERLWRVAEAYPLFLDMEEQRAEIDRFLRGVTENKTLITSERLFGDLIQGFRDHVQVTESLRCLFPSAKIILTIRRQDDFLESLYRQFLWGYYYPTVDGFLNYANHGFANPVRPSPTYPSINVWRLDYYVYAQNYAAAFGRDNVLILPHEMLRSDPRRFHTELASFMGIEPYYPPDGDHVNPSYSLLSCRIALLLNRFVRGPGWERRPWRVIPHQPLTPYLSRRGKHDLTYRVLDAVNRRLSLRYMLENVVNHLPSPHGRFISDEKRALIMDIHRVSNQKLDEEYGVNLQQYGYY
jgi:hypothetical protein